MTDRENAPVAAAQGKVSRARKKAGDFHYRYHKRWHGDALRGMSDLNPEQRGVYNTLIDLQYERRGPLPNDDAWLARTNNCPLRTFRRIKAELVAKGRIEVDEEAGSVFDKRCIEELTDAGVLRQTLSEAGRRGAAKRAKKRDNFSDFSVETFPKVTAASSQEQQLSEKKAVSFPQASQNPDIDNPERESTGPDVASAGSPATLTGGEPAPPTERQPEQDRAAALLRAGRRNRQRTTSPAPAEDLDERQSKLDAERERLRRAFESEAAA